MRERFGRARGGEEREQRRLLAREDAAGGGERRDPGALVVAEPEADLVLLDHGDVGVGDGVGAAHQRLDGGEALLAGLGVERLQRHQPAPAGDQAVGQGARLGHQRRHLDRRALAVGADRLAQGPHLVVLGRQAVAGQVVGGDGVERQVEHHAAGVAGAGDAVGEILQRRGAGGLGGDPGDRRGRAEPGQQVGARDVPRAEHRGRRRGRGSGGGGPSGGLLHGSGLRRARRGARRRASSRLKAA